MVFSDPRWLWLLLAVPMLLLLEWHATRRSTRALTLLVGPRRDPVLLSQVRSGERQKAAVVRLAAFVLLVLGAAAPEWGREVVKRGATGSDVVLVMDVSASMDARDVPPSRLSEARREALAVVDRMAGSRIGLVAFAGDAVRLCPLTLDRAAARLAIEGLSTGSVSEPGTDLGKALRTALKLIPTGRRDEQAIVLWTDGEATEPGARDAFADLDHAGVRVFAIGVGTVAGDVVPVLDAEGHTVDVKRDEQGQAVRSRLDEGYLRALAGRTRGRYLSAHRPGGELPRLITALSSLARAGRGERIIERPVARFPWFAGLAALLLLIDRVRARRRKGLLAPRAPSHARAGVTAALALVVFVSMHAPAAAQSAWARGDAAFKARRYAEAESLYAQRMKGRALPAVQLNHATAQALGGHVTEAEAELRRLVGQRGAVGHMSGYNLGTLLGEQQRYDDALQTLRQVLERHPGDDGARWNYEVLMKRREEARQPPPPAPTPPQPDPRQQPQPHSGQAGSPQTPQPQPQAPPPAGGSPPPQAGGQVGSGGMSREQAEQLLDALEELSRGESQRQRQVRAVRPKRGKDW